jgi:acetyl esterase/lipase
MALWMPKLFAGALAPWLAVVGAVSAVLGGISRSRLAVGLGAFGALACVRYVCRISAQPDAVARTFGDDWREQIEPVQSARLRNWRWTWRLPQPPEPCWERDIAFWTIPNASRELLCDLWQPLAGVTPSGLALIFFHGSAWYMLDKDYGTRTFFRHLAAQGHVIMDVAYRLAPETDLVGMVGDVKRAIAWMKANAARYNVNPDRIVLGGASAGGHLSLLAAYTPQLSELTPADVRSADLSVRGVVSYYGPSDLRACYYHTRQDQTTVESSATAQAETRSASAMLALMRAALGDSGTRLGFDKPSQAGAFKNLLGGHPDQVPDKYALLSPLTHVHAGCPSTLLIQGEDDLITPVAATRALAGKLRKAGVPVVNIVFPQTDHGFDLALPRYSPSAQTALGEVERFLALMAAPRARQEIHVAYSQQQTGIAGIS